MAGRHLGAAPGLPDGDDPRPPNTGEDGNRMKWIMALATILVLGGCSSAKAPSVSTSATTPKTQTSTPSPPSTTYAANANHLASAVRGCSQVVPLPRGEVAAAVTSLAQCTLRGTKVLFVTYADAAGQSAGEGKLFRGPNLEAFYASGTGYTAVTMATDGPIATQRTVATIVVAALGGQVKHYVP